MTTQAIPFWQNLDFWNFAIAFIALIISIIALIHSIYYNLVKLKISNCIAARLDKGYDWLYSFEVSNLSNISVIITKIELYSKTGKLLSDNQFDPEAKFNFEQEIEYQQELENRSPFLPSIPPVRSSFDYSWCSNPFSQETEVFPNSKVEFSYYLDEEPHTIKISTDKRIHRLRKHQSFIVGFQKEV